MLKAAKMYTRKLARKIVGYDDSLSAVKADLQNLLEESSSQRIPDRIDRLEKLLGISNDTTSATPSIPGDFELLLEHRIAQVEARFLAYLEGPFQSRRDAEVGSLAEKTLNESSQTNV